MWARVRGTRCAVGVWRQISCMLQPFPNCMRYLAHPMWSELCVVNRVPPKVVGGVDVKACVQSCKHRAMAYPQRRYSILCNVYYRVVLLPKWSCSILHTLLLCVIQGTPSCLTTGQFPHAFASHLAHNQPTMWCTTHPTNLSRPSHSKYVGRAGTGTPKRRTTCRIIKAIGNKLADYVARASSTMQPCRGPCKTSPADVPLNNHGVPSLARKSIVKSRPEKLVP